MTAHVVSGWRREQREAFAQLALLLAAPVLPADARPRAAAILEASGPLPAVHAHRAILPLLRHRLDEIAIAPEAAFADPRDRAQPTALLAAEHFRRAAALEETLAACATESVTPMLLKGAAVAMHYPSPVLRTMCDLDLAVPAADAAAAQRALARAGWTRGDSGGGAWRRGDGSLLDLHVPARAAAEAMLARAVAAPVPGARVPAPGDHLALLAEHVLRSQGETVWKHLADARMLLHAHGVAEADGAALAPPEERALAADFLDVLPALREDSPPATIRARFLHAMALDQSPPEVLHLARRMHMRFESDAPAGKAPGAAASRTGAAGLAALSSGERVGLALKFAAGYAFRSEVRRIVALAKSQRRFTPAAPLFRCAP
jgi:hypothetical protein